MDAKNGDEPGDKKGETEHNQERRTSYRKDESGKKRKKLKALLKMETPKTGDKRDRVSKWQGEGWRERGGDRGEKCSSQRL